MKQIQNYYYIGFRKTNKFPGERSIVSIDSSIIQKHIDEIVERRDSFATINFPVMNVHNLSFKTRNPSYPYTHQIPKTDYEISNKLSNSKLSLYVHEVITYDNTNSIDFKLSLNEMFKFHHDIKLEDQFIIVNESDIETTEIVLLEQDFIYINEDDREKYEFSFYDIKTDKYKAFVESKTELTKENLDFIVKTGMKEYSVLAVTSYEQESNINVSENENTAPNLFDFIQNSILEDDDHYKVSDINQNESDEDEEVFYDFNLMIDSNPILYVNPLSKYTRKIYDAVISSYEKIFEEEVDPEFQTLISAKIMQIMSSAEINLNFYDENNNLINEENE